MPADVERTDVETEAPATGGAGFWIAVVVGGAIGAYGLRGLLGASSATRPSQSLVGAFGLDVLHDAVLAPVACVVGFLLARFLPVWLRRPVRAGLFASFVVVLIGWAPLRGYGRALVPDNPTVDPLHYATAITTALVVVWILVAAWSIWAFVRRRSAR